MEKIEITTRFSKDGALVPAAFTLGDMVVTVLDIGRQWESEEGRHILVMDASQTTYHLFFQLADQGWYRIRDLQGPTGRV